MNMVALLSIVPILDWSNRGPLWLYVVGILCIGGVAWAVWRSKTESKELREMGEELAASAEAGKSLEAVGSTN